MALDSLSTLEKIRTKIRRLTKSPSASQIADDTVDDYVNNFVLYDFPETLRLFSLRKTFTFYTEPFQDVYTTNSTDPTDPLYNFKNLYITVQTPTYIAGVQAWYTQSFEEFFFERSVSEQAVKIATGNGVTTAFGGTLSNFPVLKNRLNFTTVSTTSTGIVVNDDGDGNLVSGGVIVGAIDYVTGAYLFTFPATPASGEAIYSNSVPYEPSRPNSILYFNDEFIVRPVPDRPYRVDITVLARPIELLSDSQEPELAQWWQYIALGAARKILIDRLDMDTVALIDPEFQKQETMVLRRTIMQQSQQQVPTIFNDENCSTGFDGNFNPWRR